MAQPSAHPQQQQQHRKAVDYHNRRIIRYWEAPAYTRQEISLLSSTSTAVHWSPPIQEDTLLLLELLVVVVVATNFN